MALFGKGTIDYVKGGGGSGDVASPYVHNILDGFLALSREVSVFPDSAEFYRHYVQEAYSQGGIPGLIPEPAVPGDLLQRAAAWTDTAVVSFSRYSGEGWDRKSDFGGPEYEPEDGFTHIHLGRIYPYSSGGHDFSALGLLPDGGGEPDASGCDRAFSEGHCSPECGWHGRYAMDPGQ